MITWLGVVQDDLRANASLRKRAIRAYRREVLYPALHAYDTASFLSSVNADWPYHVFQDGLAGPDFKTLRADWHHDDWFHLKVWSVTRVLGRWPLPLFGIDNLPRTLDTCPCCNTTDVDIRHILCKCKGTSNLRRLFDIPCKNSDAILGHLFITQLNCDQSGSLTTRVMFVSAVFKHVVETLNLSSAINDFITNAAQSC